MTEAITHSYDRELRVAIDLAREAGARILEFYEQPITIEQKYELSYQEPVTQADKIANQLIVERIAHEFPDDGILAEESEDTARRLTRPGVWMMHPLDGTNGFVHRND